MTNNTEEYRDQKDHKFNLYLLPYVDQHHTNKVTPSKEVRHGAKDKLKSFKIGFKINLQSLSKGDTTSHWYYTDKGTRRTLQTVTRPPQTGPRSEKITEKGKK